MGVLLTLLPPVEDALFWARPSGPAETDRPAGLPAWKMPPRFSYTDTPNIQ